MLQKKNPLFFLFLIAFFFFIGCLIYLYGFTASSTTSAKHSQKGNPYVKEMKFKDLVQRAIYEKQWFPTQSSQVIFLILDSLPHYYVIDEEAQKQKVELGKLHKMDDPKLKLPSTDVPFPEFLERVIEEPQNSVLLKAYSHPPTYTTLRIKAMLQGILPSYDQLTSNLGSKELKADNIFTQAKINNPFEGGKGGKVLSFGSHFIHQLYPNTFDRGNFVGEVQFYLREKNDIEQFKLVEPEQMENDDWSAMLIHFDGIDAASHITDSLDDTFKNTIKNVNNLVKKLIQNVKDSTVNTDQTVIAVSDHGINYEVNGHHGGYTALECNSFMFGFSKHQFITKDKKDIGQDMDTEFHAEPDVFQINITPTYCMLLGIPIPANNLGMIQPDFFLDKPEVDDFVIANNYYTNFRQVEDSFLEKIKGFTGVIEAIEDLKKLSFKIKEDYYRLFTGKEGEDLSVNTKGLKGFVDLCQLYSAEVINSIQKDLQGEKIEYMWLGLTIHLILAFFILSVIASMKLLSVDSQTQQNNMFSSIVDLMSSTKILVAAFLVVCIVLSQIFMFRIFMILLGLLTIFVLLFISSMKVQVLIKSWKLSSGNIISQFSKENSFDVFIFIASVALFTLTRTSNDYFDFYIDIFGLYFNIICLIFVGMFFYKRSKGEISSELQFSQFVIKIMSLPILFLVCDYYNLNAESRYNSPPPFYGQLIANLGFKFYIPLVIFLAFFGYVFYRLQQFLNNQISKQLKMLFLYLHLAQLVSIAIYYLCEWEIMSISNSPTILPTSVLFHTILIEVLKVYLFSKEQHQQLSITYKTIYFLLNTGAGLVCILEWNSLIQLPIFFSVAYLLCSILIDLRAVSMISVSCILFYLSQFFFQLSGHLEYLEELHADVFQIGVITDKSLFFPIFNGVVNTLYYFLVTPAFIPIFMNFMNNSYQEEVREKGLFNVLCSMKSSEEIQIQQQEELDCEIQEQQNNQNREIEGESTREISNMTEIQELNQKSSFLFYSLAFLAHVLIGIIGSDIRNIVKPMDTNKENMYVPNYMFLMTYMLIYLISTSINIIFLKSVKDQSDTNINFYSKLQQNPEQADRLQDEAEEY